MKRHHFFQYRLFILPAIMVALLMTSAGCMDMGGSGRLVWYETEDGTTPIIPELPADEPDDPTSPLIPSAPEDDGGGSGASSEAYVPEVQFDFEESAYRSMAERSITMTFEDAVDDCGTPAVDALIEVTDASDTPLDDVYDYTWNEVCTELTLQSIPLTYATLYKVLLKQGLSFAGNELQTILATEFTTPGNYYSINATRYGNYPTILREDTMSPYWASIYAGSDILPATLPRDPISFEPEDITPTFEYVESHGDSLSSPHMNAGDGKFLYPMSNALLLWRDVSLSPITVTLPAVSLGSEVQTLSVTDQSDPDATSLNGNSIQDVVIGAYNMDDDNFGIYVFYDWQNETENLAYTDADWSLTAYSGYGADIGDFNGDGRPDVCALSMDNWTERRDVECYLGTATGLSETPVVIFLMQWVDEPYTLRMGDVNCDGMSDVVIGGYSMDQVTEEAENIIAVLPGGSDLTGTLEIGIEADLQQAYRIESANTEFGLDFSVNDLNGDGCADIFAPIRDKNPYMLAFKGMSSIAYGDPQTVDADTAASIVFTDDDVSSMADRFATYLDINGDGYKDLMYDEVVIDYENVIWLHEQLFMPGGSDFFGPDQTTINRSDTSAQFIDLTGPLAM